MKSKSLQQAQEDEYEFPYHHIAQFKDGFSECLYDTWGINYAATIEFLLDILEKQNFGSLIDIGCGDGRLVKEIAFRFPGRRVIGVDYSIRALSLARALNARGEFYHANLLNQCIDAQFDLATMIEVLEHIDPAFQDIFIKNASTLLKPNGTLLLTVPHDNIPLGYKHFRHFSFQSLWNCLNPYFKIADCIFLEKISRKKYFIDTLLVNRFFVLNNKVLKNCLYRYYKSKLFLSDSEKNCGRIYIRAILKK